MNKIMTAAVAFALLSPGLHARAADAEVRHVMAQQETLDPDQRALKTLSAMTLDEKIKLVFGYFSTDLENSTKPREGIQGAAGFVYGVERLGIPDQQITDAGVGVATQSASKNPRARTSQPANIAVAATWNPPVGFAGGAMIGNEARLSGHNVMLAGGANLQRDPRNGRNFEYAGEDPLLAGVMVGEQIRGIQSQHVISTLKHFAYNDQETGRFFVDVKIDDAAGRMSDLLAFQIAIERGNPGSVMCSYNRTYGVYGCEHDFLLNKVLKGQWGYQGYVMSDWGGTHSTIPAALAGLDQQSGWPFDKSPYFNGALKEAVENGHVPPARLDDMVRRILRAMYTHGVADHPVRVEPENIDFAGHARISQATAEEAIVLLKNKDNLLPLADTYQTIAIIGGHADVGVLSGGGSSQVYPEGGSPVPNEGPASFPGPIVYHPSSPLKALAARLRARLVYHDGKDPAAAAKLAAASDLAIVFATQWTAESLDQPDLKLPHNQDATIAAVAGANRRTVVVLETGAPVAMPWLESVGTVVEAWYPGSRGGEAIARVLTGEVDASGRLPATFPADESQLPRPALDGKGLPEGARFSVDYDIEGAAVGYKWFDKKGLKPLFPFGHGLSYTTFSYSGLKAQPANGTVQVSFNVQNTGRRDGKAVPQVYVSKVGGGWEAPKRLGGWNKLSLRSGETRQASVTIDPRVLAMFDKKTQKWKVAAGDYKVIVANSAAAPIGSVVVKLPAREFAAGGR
ncbi:beta-glucosidase [Duganella radicis]|uniref:Glycosyl hydrolase n=1 Tax=Duganella radicis TaxID=551988 RepID=A0A6L6PF95_9BURK|nr:glycoside hydrolase family 3 protein [Duganella radicis]MTV37750.1 glycosyl hydrolase [Duganella radicis]